MTEAAVEPSAAAPSARPRPARRGVGELTYRLDPDVVEARAAREPGWLAEDRRSGLEAFERLPIEPNQLYTGYVDLRGADLADVRDDAPAVGGHRLTFATVWLGEPAAAARHPCRPRAR